MDMKRGFREIAHTADWELEAWAPDFVGLVEQAVLGMNQLAGLALAHGSGQRKLVEIQGDDPESLLVGLMNELVFIQETRGLGARTISVRISGNRLQAQVVFVKIEYIQKVIKAVTWHQMKVKDVPGGLSVRIVFDV